MTNPQIKIIDLLNYTLRLTPKITEGYQSTCYQCNMSIEETVWVRKLNYNVRHDRRCFRDGRKSKHIPIKYYHLNCAKRLNMI